ncbi:uncharacterized protein LOC111249661 [Varroa destructor]|uniref:Uncharacterized protein n=1 Tax=Varroa destructor TaxID=109461 RepID=A0A7M7KDS6_VARDE|nr:uncharacterized protein LOC111249661 [Varroa destructor]XP_022659554.1 uncharacterized protein LOC111249661 [Varroa destructor]
MAQKVLYEAEVFLALASVALVEKPSLNESESNGDSSHSRWDSWSPSQRFRLYSNLIRYEQFFFERYICDSILDAERQWKLEDEAKIVRKMFISYLKKQPDIAQLITIYSEDRGSFRIPIRVEDISHTLRSLGCFERFLRRSSGLEVSLTVAKTKSIQRIRTVFEEHFPKEFLASNACRDTEAYAEHNGVQAQYHPHVMPVSRRKYNPVLSSATLKFRSHETLQAMSIGLAALARSAYSSSTSEESHYLKSEDLNEIIESGKYFFSDTVLLLRQLYIQDAGRGSLTEMQLENMLKELGEKLELTPFNCRAISSTRKTNYWRGLKMRHSYNLTETEVQNAITNFFLSAKMALVVAKHAVLALFDSRIRGAIELTASSDHLIHYPDINILEAIKVASKNFQGAGVFYMIDECPRQEIIPRPIDQTELKTWPELEQWRYRKSVRRFLEHQERLRRRLNMPSKSTSAEHRIWRVMLAEEQFDGKQDALTLDGNSAKAILGYDLLKNVFTTKKDDVVQHISDIESDNSLSSSSSTSNSSSFISDEKSNNGNVTEPLNESKSPTVTSTTEIGIDGIDIGKNTRSSTPTYEGVESIFSDEENRVPISRRTTSQYSGEASCKIATLTYAIEHPKTTSTSSDLKMGQSHAITRIIRPESLKTPCLGEAVEDASNEPEEKRVRRDFARDKRDDD